MPELQFGDVIKYGDNEYCIVGTNRVYYLRSLDKLIVPIERSMRKLDVQDSPLVEIVYRRGTCGFDQEDLGCIYNEKNLDQLAGYIIWKRPKVREMTVDEISKELGYTVKVIGKDR